MALRKLVHDGEEFDITPHIKFGTRKPKLLRLYFAICRDSQRLIVGYFGDHLDLTDRCAVKVKVLTVRV
jgi:hypothetical protein